ncbi:adenylate/guanylate cyclase domain-containing protein [Candidatus Reidiella endopervernicosa]|uniref:adenylate/guanylate cyclase domain-containing protein n=1 Tax=Candidatus Reidiella endopervernicosa TaxID=2738883 RepID=UPI002351AA74|nr:adenylate/guanylate cyclase domain-containing protein [Candidatus Reidiella endopervernicosa]
MRDKIVIIGSTATGLVDLRVTPIDNAYPAVEILATAIDNLKRGDYLRSVPKWISPLLAVLMVLLFLFGFRRLHSPLKVGFRLALFTPLLMVAAYVALDSYRLQLPLFAPLAYSWLFFVAAALYSYLNELRARQRSIAIFNRFLDPRVVGELVDHGETVFDMRGEKREVTVLFSDIRGFTTLSEQSTPEQIVALLNDYFSRQVKVIFHHGGTVDKFIGDAIMAFWGAPVDDPDQAVHAVTAALEMSEALLAFRESLGESGTEFDIGIGIHTGPAVVGFIGSENRLDYTAIGDTVNLASRIEGQTKGRCRVLVSEETRQRCGELFDFHDHGSYKVKGRAQEVRLYEPRRS